MSISVNALSRYGSKTVSRKAVAEFKRIILLALEKSWSGDHTLPVSTLKRNLDGSTKTLLQTAIHELRKAGIVEFAYCEGWSVGIRLAVSDLARPEPAHH